MNKQEQIDKILEDMIDFMGDGGMDTSYGGANYKEAKKIAIEKIITLLKSPNNHD